ncbi:MAG: prepilin-type N-terminal cleavage/methylation domain-containing protein [Methylophilaceae bacterium]|nr:prepilin-type N-terminal cleavage/methylation domain-containing protein [Methylophilaceae bacterium]
MAFYIISGKQKKSYGFTFVELMIVMAMLALLLSIALPRYFAGLQRAKEAVLREDLATMRDAISHYREDKGSYPPTLNLLIEQKYLRAIPIDPITDKANSWMLTQPPDLSSNVYDVHSGAPGTATDGSRYSEW